MIGSALNRIATAEKLSVGQLQEAIRNKTIPAYIGIPLLEEKMEFEQRMRNSAVSRMAQAQQPSLGDQVMAAAQTRGIDSLPSGLNPVEMAGGGIVAFDDGGEVVHAYNGLPPDQFVNPYLAQYIRQMETGGMRNPDLAVSSKGAVGRMQIMPQTAMKPGFNVPSIFDLADAAGVKYKGKTEEEAKRLLTNPDLNVAFGERYAGAMQAKFGDNPVLAAAAFNAGPAAVTKAGGVPDIAETKKYVAGISPERFEAARKSVQDSRRAQLKDLSLSPTGVSLMPYRSVMEGEDKPPVDYEALLASRERKPVEAGLGTTFDQFLQTPPSEGIAEIAPARPTAKDVQERQDLFSKYLSGEVPLPGPTLAQQALKQTLEQEPPKEKDKVAKTETEAPKKETYGEKLERLLTEREGRMAAQREEDRNLAIIAAGLGMMGGTSPYAAANIGPGALKGLEQYAGARKLARQEEEDILAGRLGQYRYGEESRLRAEDRRLDQGMKLASLEEKRIRDEFSNIIGNVLDPRSQQLKELLKRDPDYVNRQAITARNRILQKYGVDISGEEPVGSTVNKDYSKWGKLKVG